MSPPKEWAGPKSFKDNSLVSETDSYLEALTIRAEETPLPRQHFNSTLSWEWAKEKVHPRFYWQNGYGAFSVSATNEARVIAYIQKQEDHHRETTFQDEVRDLMHRTGQPLDERYFWD